MKAKRPIVLSGDVAFVPLTKGKRAIIDSRDVALVEGKNWYATQRGRDLWYAASRNTNGGGIMWMHRLILQPPDKLETDHVNHDGLDNRRSNLRTCTRSENQAHGRKMATSSSKFRGVCWDKRGSKWHAEITKGGKNMYIGLFASELDAARAYDNAAQELHGEFASLNFPRLETAARKGGRL